MQRTLHPELLDSLPPNHPDALHNRRDLRVTNAITGNHRWFARVLPRLLRPGETALEIGAGTGELGLRLAAAGVAVDGLDLWPRPDAWPANRRWHVADVRTFAGYDGYAGVIGNLIFHQFTDSELRALGERMGQHVRLVVAVEPARRRLSQILYRALGPLFGANHVTLHDAHVSIGAGFRRDELPRALGLGEEAWHIDCRTTTLGIYRMVAIRRT